MQEVCCYRTMRPYADVQQNGCYYVKMQKTNHDSTPYIFILRHEDDFPHSIAAHVDVCLLTVLSRKETSERRSYCPFNVLPFYDIQRRQLSFLNCSVKIKLSFSRKMFH
jgi:hypothetical protein